MSWVTKQTGRRYVFKLKDVDRGNVVPGICTDHWEREECLKYFPNGRSFEVVQLKKEPNQPTENPISQ